MQYVRSFSGSVSKTWNSINPATLSGAIDVIVVEQEDGSLACSPFHVRFGKFSLLRPYEKKVEFKVNNVKQDYAMKLGEGGEAFFVFETSDNIPEALQTSPLISPASSPPSLHPGRSDSGSLQEPDFLDLDRDSGRPRAVSRPSSGTLPSSYLAKTGNLEALTPLSTSPGFDGRPTSGDWSSLRVQPDRSASEQILPSSARTFTLNAAETIDRDRLARSASPVYPQYDAPPKSVTDRSSSPPPVPTKEAIERAIALSKHLSASNIPSQVTDTGDLMLDMTGYKSSDDDALRAEVIARKILSEELEGNYDIGALIGADEHGNLWIYSSEEAKEAASQRAAIAGLNSQTSVLNKLSDNASDPGYQSDDAESETATPIIPMHRRADSEGAAAMTPPKTPPDSAGDPNRNYAKTLRLTSDQLKALNLKQGPNPVSFTVNRSTCQAYMYLWSYSTPIVISDIDGTITKSDALGHVLTMIGRDWTHIGVAKLYTEIVSNGYNIMYLTSRNVGQADATRAYLNGVVQENYRLPKGPTIMSPDRTIAALRRELYIRKPEVFKMACLRDIKNLFGPNRSPFYAGFGNRLTDALSYRSVSIPSNRIFTINSYAEVSLDLLSLNKLKLSYVNMREVVDHYFPPVGMLVAGGGEEFTDFNYWRDMPMEVDDFSDSDDEDDHKDDRKGEEEEDDDEVGEGMGDSYISRDSIDENSILEDEGEGEGEGEGYDDEEEEGDDGDQDQMTSSMIEEEEGEGEGEVDEAEDDEVESDPETPGISGYNGVGLEPRRHSELDGDAEIITGVQGLSVENE